MIEAGYVSVSQVASPGEYAVRGSLFDVYPMGTTAPLRIDLFDDEIEAIRRFDPDTQRSLDSLERVRLLPAREIPLDPDGVREFRRRFRTRFEGDPTRATIYRGVSEGVAPAGIEFYVPLFFDETATLFDYLPANAVLVHDADAAGRAWQGVGRISRRGMRIAGTTSSGRCCAPAELFISPEDIDTRLAQFASITLNAFKVDTELQGGENVFNFPTAAPSELRIDARAEHPFAPLDLFLNEFDGRVLIAADSPGRREVLQEMLRGHGYTIAPGARAGMRSRTATPSSP